jgi:hypothetical protein
MKTGSPMPVMGKDSPIDMAIAFATSPSLANGKSGTGVGGLRTQLTRSCDSLKKRSGIYTPKPLESQMPLAELRSLNTLSVPRVMSD